jgi:hypothetical protein
VPHLRKPPGSAQDIRLRGSAAAEDTRDIRSDQLIWCTRCALRMFPQVAAVGAPLPADNRVHFRGVVSFDIWGARQSCKAVAERAGTWASASG